MSLSIKVVIEFQNDHWKAWFDEFPQITRCGKFSDDALQALLKLFGDDYFQIEQIAVIDESTNERHIEVMVPMPEELHLPPFSQN